MVPSLLRPARKAPMTSEIFSKKCLAWVRNRREHLCLANRSRWLEGVLRKHLPEGNNLQPPQADRSRRKSQRKRKASSGGSSGAAKKTRTSSNSSLNNSHS